LSLQDPETGEVVWADTSSKAWRQSYQQRLQLLEMDKQRIFRQSKVARIKIGTNEDYTNPLMTFFDERAKRIRR
jgi:hypothetical protein